MRRSASTRRTRAPELWFPRGDVVDDALRPPTAPGGRCGDLADHVAFDHEQVRLELIDAVPGDDPRDVTDQAVPDVGRCRRPHRDHRRAPARATVAFESVGARASDWRRPVVEGSQILGQSIVAASPARAGPPGGVGVDGLPAGRRRADALPHRRSTRSPAAAPSPPCAPRPPRATAPARSARCCSTSPRPTSSGTPIRLPTCPGRTSRPPTTCRSPAATSASSTTPTPATPTPGRSARAGRVGSLPHGARRPADPRRPARPVHRPPVDRRRPPPHAGIGQDQAHRTLSTAINAISLSIHREVRADRWMLYHHRSTFAGDGMTHAECRVYDEDGDVLASFTVDAMVRGLRRSRPRPSTIRSAM